MTRMFRIGIMVAGAVAAGLVVYELVREAMESEAEPAAQGRPPYAETAEYAAD